MDVNSHIYLPVLFPDIGPFKSEWLIPLWNNLGLCTFQLGMAHSTVELPNLFQIGTAHFTVPLTHTVSGHCPFRCGTASAISGHCPFQLGVAHSTVELPRSVSGHCPFHCGTVQCHFRALPLSNRNGPFHCFRILPVSALFQDIAPFTSVSGYCPFELCFRILPL